MRTRPRWRGILLVLPLAFLTGCATPPLPEDSVSVVGLMAERLTLARDVAWAKWTTGLPVCDLDREKHVLEKLVRQGEAADIDEGLTTRFVRAQIEASCIEQEAWMKRWNSGEPLPPGEPPALEALRPRLDRLSAMLVAEYAAAWNTPPTAARKKLEAHVRDRRSAAIAASGFVGQ